MKANWHGRVYRVFVSSTFADFRIEREALQKHVFGEIERFCRELGSDFQAVDLRWGVDVEASVQQQTMRTCLCELKLCQEMSPRPNFIVLLGDRYGWRPLPEEIPAEEMNQILPLLEPPWREAVARNEEVSGKSGGFYRLNRNVGSAAGLYELQERTGIYARDRSRWEKEVENPLRQTLEKAAVAAKFTPEQLVKYRASATEQEIIAGALAVNDADEHVLAFERVLTSKTMVAAEADSDLIDLKARLRKRLGANYRQFTLDRQPESADDPALRDWCQHVKSELLTTITAEMERFKTRDVRAMAAYEWWAMVANETRNIVGREEECAALLRAPGEPTCGFIRVITGERGMGKTACLARCAQMIKDAHTDSTILGRFCGSTPDYSDVRGVFGSIAQQIRSDFNLGEAAPESDGLQAMLNVCDLLAGVVSTRKVFLLLDAVDSLESDAMAIYMPAMLRRIASLGVHVIVALSPGAALDGFLKSVEETDVLKLGRMRTTEAKTLLLGWLSSVHRRITDGQRDAIIKAFEQVGSPYWLRLCFAVACSWPSTLDKPDDLPLSTDQMLQYYIDYMCKSRHHGHLLLSRTLEFIACSSHGLAEADLMRILSTDSEVMNEVNENHPDSHAIRLPPIVWSRLRLDLEVMLTRKQAWGSILLDITQRGEAHRLIERLGEKGYATRLEAMVRRFTSLMNAPYALAEAALALQRLGRFETLATFLSNPVCIEKRCLAKQVWFVLRDLSALEQKTDETRFWEQLLKRHSRDLSTGLLSIFTLLSAEAPDRMKALRRIIANPRRILGPFFEHLPAWSPVENEDAVAMEIIHDSGQCEPSFVVALSMNPATAFRYLRHGIVERIPLDDNKSSRSVITTAVNPPISMAVSANGRWLACIDKTGEGCVFLTDEDSDSMAQPVSKRIHLKLPQREAPVVVWLGSTCVWQSSDGTIQLFNATSRTVRALPLLDAWREAELAAVAGDENLLALALRMQGNCAVQVCEGGSSRLLKEIQSDSPSALASLPGGQWVLGLCSCRVLLLRPDGSVSENFSVEWPPLTFAIDPTGLFWVWVSEDGHLWLKNVSSSKPQTIRLGDWLVSIALVNCGPGVFAVASNNGQRITRFVSKSLPRETKTKTHLFPQLRVPGGYYAFRTRIGKEGGIDGVDAIDAFSRTVLAVGAFRPGWITTAEIKGIICCLAEDGTGFLYDMNDAGAFPVTGMGESVLLTSAVAVEYPRKDDVPAQIGFFITGLTGAIHFINASRVDRFAQPTLAHRLNLCKASKAVLLRSGDILVWYGIDIRDIGSGPEDIFGMTAFRIDMRHPGKLQTLGHRSFTTGDGNLCAVCFEGEKGDLLLFWSGHREHGRYLMRGSIIDIMNGVEQRVLMPAEGEVPVQAAACRSHPYCLLRADSGQVSLLDLRTKKVASILPASFGVESMEYISADQIEVLCADDSGRVFIARARVPKLDIGEHVQ